MILDKVNTPDDVKRLSVEEMGTLADEMRELIIKKVNTIGGHCGPNLGIVEATIALHYVFNSPKDKIVFDVSHQCYPHKIITGRKEGFLSPENYLKYTGYTAPEESDHDIFKVGHTSTSVSLATGLAKARDLRGENYNVIALIGDGSLSGGEAFEGLDNAAVLGSNFIVVVNDNDMSIAPNEGGLYKNLKLLRDTNGQAECNYFKVLGFDYLYIGEGNNIEKLIEGFKKVKDINHPVVVHIVTEKGKGLKPATENKEMFHWIMPNTLDGNNNLNPMNYSEGEDWYSITKNYILNKSREDKSVITISPATPGVFGFNQEFRSKLGKQYIDVGIAEEHAIAFASGLAKGGAKPILNVMSSFIQRTYDQLSQDLCMNNSPITLLIWWGGISSADCTHLCTFDMAMMGNIPNLVYLAPTNKEEYLRMLDWSVNQTEYSTAIRVPSCEFISTGIPDMTDYSREINKFKMVKSGEKIAVIGLGSFFGLAQKVVEEIKSKLGTDATLINPRFISGIDKEMLDNLTLNHDVVITLEDGEVNGGFGEKIASYLGNSDIKVLNYGSHKEFSDRVPVYELYKRYRLTPSQIIEDAAACLKVGV